MIAPKRTVLISTVFTALCLALALVWFTRLRPQTVSRSLAQPPHELIANSGLYYLGADASYAGTAAYALKSAAGILVVDPGWEFPTLARAFEQVGLDIADVKVVLISHVHADHWFATRDLIELTGAKVMASARDISLLTESGDLRKYYTTHETPVEKIPVVPNVTPLHDGDIVEFDQFRLEVIETPGHTAGSVCFLGTISGYQVLWTGDTIMTLSDTGPGGEYTTRLGPQVGGSLRSYVSSLKRIAELRPDIVLPGHPLSGSERDPVSDTRRWDRLVRTRIARLETWIRDHPEKVDLFLDGVPKKLSDSVYYLGEQNTTASYALKSSSGLVCIDPGRRDFDDYAKLLAKLDLDVSEIKTVVLTSVHPDHAELAPELCQRTGARLICGESGEDTALGELRPDQRLNHGDRITVGNIKMLAFEGPASGGADIYFLTQITNEMMLVGGDSVSRFPTPGGATKLHVPSYVGAGRPVPFRLLAAQPLSLILPAHPRYDESPFLLPGEWPPFDEHSHPAETD